MNQEQADQLPLGVYSFAMQDGTTQVGAVGLYAGGRKLYTIAAPYREPTDDWKAVRSVRLRATKYGDPTPAELELVKKVNSYWHVSGPGGSQDESNTTLASAQNDLDALRRACQPFVDFLKLVDPIAPDSYPLNDAGQQPSDARRIMPTIGDLRHLALLAMRKPKNQ